jgi:hypothetical protein
MPAILTAIAAILSAVAWPLVFLTVLLAYRRPLSEAVRKIPSVIDRIQSVKIGALEAELEKIGSLPENRGSGEITSEQISVAAKIESRIDDYGQIELLKQLDKLCLEYDSIRHSMPPGSLRTSAMTNVIVRMRALAPATSTKIEVYKGSGSPGSRLAAIAMMQMTPQLGDLKWLSDRFRLESPFIFYHASLALRNMANNADEIKKSEIKSVAQDALSILKNYNQGTPDKNTIAVLASI